MNKKKVGLHLDNRVPIDEPTRVYLQAMDPAAVLVTGSTPESDIAWLKAQFPDTTIIVRVVYQAGMDHTGYYASTFSLWQMVRRYFPNEQVLVQLYNEPQFEYEGFGQSTSAIQEFYSRWSNGYWWLKGNNGEVRFGFTPMTPGNRDLPVAEDPPGTLTYLYYCQPLLALCDAMFLHIYAEYPEQVDDPWIGNRIVQYKKWSQNKPIYITESAICSKDQATRGQLTVHWFQQYVVPDPQVVAVTQWIGNVPGNPAQDPAFDQDRHFNPDGSYRRVAIDMLAYLAQPDPQEEPTPQPDLPAPPATRRLAVDVSNYTGLISPDTLAGLRSQGVVRVIVRASTERADAISIAKQQMRMVTEAGLELDAYLWVHFSGPEPEAEVATMKQEYGSFPIRMVWLDCEEQVPNGTDAIQIIERYAAVLQGAPVGIYTNRGWWTQSTGNTDRFSTYPLWDANWTETPPPPFVAYGGWERPAMVQYQANAGGTAVDFSIIEEDEVEQPFPDELKTELHVDNWKDAYVVVRGVADAWGQAYTKLSAQLDELVQAMTTNSQNAVQLKQMVDEAKAAVDAIVAGRV